MIDLGWRQHDSEVFFVLRVRWIWRFSLLSIGKLRRSHYSYSLCFIRGVKSHLVIEVNYLGNIRFTIILLMDFCNARDCLRGCCVSPRTDWLWNGLCLIVDGEGTAPNSVRTHVCHLSPHIVLLEWINHCVLQMLCHPHSILVELTLVSRIIRCFLIIHWVVTRWDASVGGYYLPWGQIPRLSHVIVCVVVLRIFKVINRCKVISVRVLSLNVDVWPLHFFFFNFLIKKVIRCGFLVSTAWILWSFESLCLL